MVLPILMVLLKRFTVEESSLHVFLFEKRCDNFEIMRLQFLSSLSTLGSILRRSGCLGLI